MARMAHQSHKEPLRLVKGDCDSNEGKKPEFRSKLAKDLNLFADDLDLLIEIIKSS